MWVLVLDSVFLAQHNNKQRVKVQLHALATTRLYKLANSPKKPLTCSYVLLVLSDGFRRFTLMTYQRNTEGLFLFFY